MPRRSRRKRTRLRVGRDDAGEAAEFGRHVGERRALVGGQRAHHGAGELEHLAHAGARCGCAGSASRCSATSLAVTPAGTRPLSSMRSDRGMVMRTAPVTSALAMSVRAHAEGDAAQRAAVRRVRIGADDQLARAARSARPSSACEMPAVAAVVRRPRSACGGCAARSRPRSRAALCDHVRARSASGRGCMCAGHCDAT